ncbi:MAG: family 14 glycosylhydrolase, partial [Candidatus Obscuribacterales bacterium]|nr:family 14 glycosylhydrolase [Candidatus Obscuribacterales bacterium]
MHMQKQQITVNVMAPLVVGNPNNVDATESSTVWAAFAQQLQEIKKYGAQAVSTDVWWGLVEAQEGSYNWTYYDKLAACILAAGLKWVPILSFHQCGGNIGDNCTVLLPAWVWKKLAALNNGDIDAARFVSEQGNASKEYVSVWATEQILPSYVALMKAFQAHFADKAAQIAELNISLGPAGELRYPSYNSHDKGTDYPTRGALQAYSKKARASFQAYIMRKYKDIAGLNKAWGPPLDPAGHVIEPPRNVEHFFSNKGHLHSQYGRDFFDWYADSLIEHGRLVLKAALDVFAADDSAFKGVDIAAKVPGVHWRMGYWRGTEIELSDRLAELAAGLIRSSLNDWREADGWGYRPLLTLFNQMGKATKNNRLVLHFTCLEMADADGAPGVNSLAYSLVRWVGREARRQGIVLKGENALAYHLNEKACWDRVRSHLDFGGNDGAYEGITFLRMGDILSSLTGRTEMSRLIAQIS